MTIIMQETRSSSTTRTEINGTQLERWTRLGQAMEWVWSMLTILVAVSEPISWIIWHKFGTL